MANFDKAFSVVLAHEGLAVSRDPDDKGGTTKYGITLAFLQDLYPEADEDMIIDMTVEQAQSVYRIMLWDRCKLDLITNDDIATKLLDALVLLGIWRGTWCAQRACMVLGRTITIDGLMGPETRSALNAVKPADWLEEMARQMEERFKRIVAGDPTQQKFLAGWIRRAAWPDESTGDIA